MCRRFASLNYATYNPPIASGNNLADPVHVTEALGGVLEDYGIKPETFLRAIVLDAVPVRAALTAFDSEYQASLTRRHWPSVCMETLLRLWIICKGRANTARI